MSNGRMLTEWVRDNTLMEALMTWTDDDDKTTSETYDAENQCGFIQTF